MKDIEKNENDTSTVELTCETRNRTFSTKLPIASHDENIVNLLIATKAQDVVAAYQAVRSQLEPHCQVVILSNGMGYHNQIAQQLPKGQTFAAVCTDGAWLRTKNHVVHAGKGTTKIGIVSPTDATPASDKGLHKDKQELLLEQLLQSLRPKHWDVQTSTTTEAILLEKLTINAAINGLTAIHNCNNGKLLENHKAKASLDSLITEITAIIIKAEHRELAASLEKRVHLVIKKTADNYSSTYTDIKLGRRSEIDFINGYVIALAEELGAKCEENQAIVQAVQALENKMQH